MNTEKIKKLDQDIVKASKKIKVLNVLSWPAGVEEKFLQSCKNGNPRLPEINLTIPDVDINVKALDSLEKQCDEKDPVEKFLAETALSYANAGRMLMAVGTPEFTAYSSKIYGRPDTIYKNQGLSGVD